MLALVVCFPACDAAVGWGTGPEVEDCDCVGMRAAGAAPGVSPVVSTLGLPAGCVLLSSEGVDGASQKALHIKTCIDSTHWTAARCRGWPKR